MSDPIIENPLGKSASRTYAKMAVVSVVGIAVLVLLGIAAFSQRPLDGGKDGFEVLAITPGTVKEVAVRAGQFVKPGDLLLTLDDTEQEMELTAARAELEAVAAENQAAGVAVAVPPVLPGMGGRLVPVGPLMERPLPGPTGDGQKVEPLPPVGGKGPAKGGGSDLDKLSAHVQELDQQISALNIEIENASHRSDEDMQAVEEARKNVEAAKVISSQRKQQAERMRSLLREGVVSQVETSRAEALYASAEGGYVAAQKQLEDRLAAAQQVSDQLSKNKELLVQKTNELEVAKEAVEKAAAAPKPTITTTPERSPSQQPSVPKPAYVKQEAPPPIPTKVEVDRSAKMEADERLQQAKARVDRAERALEGRRIVSARSGKVLRVLVKPGDQLQVGRTILVIEFEDSSTAREK